LQRSLQPQSRPAGDFGRGQAANGSKSAGLLVPFVPVIFLVLWSGGYAVAKVALLHCDPLTLLVIRYSGAFLLLLPAAVVYNPAFPIGHQWWQVGLIGLLIQGGYFGFSYLSFGSGISAGAVALIVSMQPVLVGLLAPGMVGETVGLRRWLGLLLGLAGAGLVIYARSRIEATSLFGVGAAVAALICMTTATLLEKRFALAIHPISSNLVQYAVGIAAILPLAAWLEPMHVDWSPQFVWAIAYLVIGNSIIAITLMLAMVRAGEASRVSALLFLVPPLAALIAFVLIGEPMPSLAWAGMAVAAAGVLLATVRANRNS
jgi:drug/metabolite transporter (DMT)-like permease